MTLFQWVAVPLLLVVILLDIRGLFSRRGRPFIRIGRVGMCIVASLLILMPRVTGLIAVSLGIGRGADLLLYIMLLLAPLAWFRLQTQNWLIERRLVALAREEALRSPFRASDERDGFRVGDGIK